MDRIRIQQADFSVADEYAALCSAAGDAGAVTFFCGRVRGGAEPEPVITLHLEYYPGMTERVLGDLVTEARSRWPLLAVTLLHRVGDLAAGEQIVLVGVAGRHRAAAFAACEFLIDRLKTAAPFWKREHDAAGVSRWVEQGDADRARADRWQDRA